MAGFGRTLFGFIGGVAALAIVLSLARRRGVIQSDRLILSGVLIGSQLSALLSYVILAAGEDTNKVLYWLLGDVSHVEFSDDLVLFVVLVLGTALLVSQSKRLNALAYGEETAQRLGVNVGQLTYVVLGAGAAMTAVTVGSVGMIGFLGLVAPHVARRIIGVDWRWSLPASLLCGAILLCVSDIAAQRALGLLFKAEAGLEPPVGIVTALLGAPVLAYLLKKKG
jgi:iron complex transport system permease protein